MVLLCIGMVLVCGCKSVSRVESGGWRAHRDTVMLTKWRSDTVIERDSVMIVESGELRVERVVRWRERLRTVIDTAYVCRTDSVAVPYPVEKRLSKWEQAKVDYGGYALAAVIILLTLAIWFARRWVVNRKNKQ